MWIYFNKQGNLTAKIPHGEIIRQNSTFNFYIAIEKEYFREFFNTSIKPFESYTLEQLVNKINETFEASLTILGVDISTSLTMEIKEFYKIKSTEITYNFEHGKQYLTYHYFGDHNLLTSSGTHEASLQLGSKIDNIVKMFGNISFYVEKTYNTENNNINNGTVGGGGNGGNYELPIATPTILGGIKVGGGLNIGVTGHLSVSEIYPTKQEIDEDLETALENYLAKSGGTMSGPLVITGGDAATGAGNIQLDTNGHILAKGTNSTLFGRNNDGNTLLVGHISHNLKFRGSSDVPTYNDSNIALEKNVYKKEELNTYLETNYIPKDAEEIGNVDKKVKFYGSLYEDANTAIVNYDNKLGTFLGYEHAKTTINSSLPLTRKDSSGNAHVVIDSSNINNYAVSLDGDQNKQVKMRASIIPESGYSYLNLGDKGHVFENVYAQNFVGNLQGTADAAKTTLAVGDVAAKDIVECHNWVNDVMMGEEKVPKADGADVSDYAVEAGFATKDSNNNKIIDTYFRLDGSKTMQGPIIPDISKQGGAGDLTLGTSSQKWTSVYAANFYGNATTATRASTVGTSSDNAVSAEDVKYACDTITSIMFGEAEVPNAQVSTSANYAVKAGEAVADEKGNNIYDNYVRTGNDGKIPATYLPSYVDDVVEYAGQGNFPSKGESGKIYVDITTNITYRWSGTKYVEISSSLALGTTSSTAYRGDLGAANANAITQLQKDLLNYLSLNGGEIKGAIYPTAPGAISLGTESRYWSTVYATTFNGNLTGKATSATNDGNGKQISSTYATKTELTDVDDRVSAIEFGDTTVPKAAEAAIAGYSARATGDKDGKDITTTYWKKDDLKFELSGSTLKITTK